MSQNEVIYQEAFACAVKLVEKNKPMPVRVLKANFVPKELFTEARVKTTEDRIDFWLLKRREFKSKNLLQIQSIEDTEAEYRETLVELDIPVTEEKFIIQPVPQQAPISANAPAIQYAQEKQLNKTEAANKMPIRENEPLLNKPAHTTVNGVKEEQQQQGGSIFEQFVSSSFEPKTVTIDEGNAPGELNGNRPLGTNESKDSDSNPTTSPFGGYNPLEDLTIFNRKPAAADEGISHSEQVKKRIYNESVPNAEEEAQLNSIFNSTETK